MKTQQEIALEEAKMYLKGQGYSELEIRKYVDGATWAFQWQQSQQPKLSKRLDEYKSAEQILKDNHIYGKLNQLGFTAVIKMVMDQYASQQVEQAVKVALEMASERAKVHCDDARRTEIDFKIYGYADDVYTFDERSILSLAPQVLEKLKEE